MRGTVISLVTENWNTLWSGCLSPILAAGGSVTCGDLKNEETGAKLHDDTIKFFNTKQNHNLLLTSKILVT